MSSLGRDNLINYQVAPTGRTVILTCGVLLSHRFGLSPAYRVAPADPRDDAWGSYSLRSN